MTLEQKPIDLVGLRQVLGDILASVEQRGDINECILASICTLLLDFAFLVCKFVYF